MVRDARVEDANSIARILNDIISARIYTALDTPVTSEEQRRFIETFPPRGIFHVAVAPASHDVIGLQDVSPFADYTHAFDHVGIIGTYVDLACHRRGIAARLFESTYRAALLKGYEKLFTYVRADNAAGLRAYLGQGFRVVGTAARHARIDGRYIDEIVIEKIL
jgi:L-amino acid N-acyltransferase YncA